MLHSIPLHARLHLKFTLETRIKEGIKRYKKKIATENVYIEIVGS